LKQLDVLKQYRGTRGDRVIEKRIWDTNDGVHLHYIRTLPQNVSTRITNFEHRHNSNINSLNPDNLRKITFEPLSVCKGQTKSKVCCHNSRPVKNKSLAFSGYILSNNFDIIDVTETWLGVPGDTA
jgi:hypothetical protein